MGTTVRGKKENTKKTSGRQLAFDLFTKGKSKEEVMKELSLTPNSVKTYYVQYRKELKDMKGEKMSNAQVDVQLRRDAAFSLFQKGMRITDTAKQLQLPYSTVARYHTMWGSGAQSIDMPPQKPITFNASDLVGIKIDENYKHNARVLTSQLTTKVQETKQEETKATKDVKQVVEVKEVNKAEQVKETIAPDETTCSVLEHTNNNPSKEPITLDDMVSKADDTVNVQVKGQETKQDLTYGMQSAVFSSTLGTYSITPHTLDIDLKQTTLNYTEFNALLDELTLLKKTMTAFQKMAVNE